MGYYERMPPPEEQRPGCLEALLITRIVFGVLFWPMVLLFGVLLDASLIFLLYVTNAPLALIPIAVTGAAIWLFSRWEQRRHRPPDA